MTPSPGDPQAFTGVADLPAGIQAADPRWTVRRLEERLLLQQQPLVNFLDNYYEGRHRLAFASSKFREAFADMLAAVSDNWMSFVVNTRVERMHVQGFRFSDAEVGDRAAWDIWQRNDLDVGSTMAFREAIKHGEAALLVWWDNRDDTKARITVEHPSQVIVERSTGDRCHRLAALKRWVEVDGSVRATLWTPTRVYRFIRRAPLQGEMNWMLERSQQGFWEPLEVDGSFPNPLGVVPVIPLTNDPHMKPVWPPNGLDGVPTYAHVGLGRSDLLDVISTQDSINKLICDMLVASEVAGFRQRWATGLEVPKFPEGHAQAGQPIQPFENAVNRLWVSEDPQTSFGEFQATDLSNFVKALESRVTSLAARSHTPAHYMLGNIVNASGEALKAAESGLASKVREKQTSFCEPLEEALRIAFAIQGDTTRAQAIDAETIWANPEVRSESELVDSLVKKLAIGVPPQQLWEDAGYSPQQIDRFRGLLAEWAATQPVLPALAPPVERVTDRGGIQPTGGDPHPVEGTPTTTPPGG